jgi:hypothetical protein
MFVDAHKAQPKGKNVKVSKAGIALNNINKLYRVERQSADLRCHRSCKTDPLTIIEN